MQKMNWKWFYYYVWPVLLLTRTGIVWVIGTLMTFLVLDLLGYSSAAAGFMISGIFFIVPSGLLAGMSVGQLSDEIMSLPEHERTWRWW